MAHNANRDYDHRQTQKSEATDCVRVLEHQVPVKMLKHHDEGAYAQNWNDSAPDQVCVVSDGD